MKGVLFMSDCHMGLNVDDVLNHPTTQAFIRLLKGGIAAEGNSSDELEEISETLAKTVTDEIINQ